MAVKHKDYFGRTEKNGWKVSGKEAGKYDPDAAVQAFKCIRRIRLVVRYSLFLNVC